MSNKKVNINFYDIESIANVFTLCNYDSKRNHTVIYYLMDDNMNDDGTFSNIITDENYTKQLIESRLKENLKIYEGTIELKDLKVMNNNAHLAQVFGLSNADIINNPESISDYPYDFRLVCDTDSNYNEELHPYLMGYNSHQYDTTILTEYLYNVFHMKDGECLFTPTTGKDMRDINDNMFLPDFKKNMYSYLQATWNNYTKRWDNDNFFEPNDRMKIRKNMMLSGRHVDVAKLNEKQQFAALKKTLGTLGYQILESDKLKDSSKKIETLDEFVDLIVYNICDCVYLEKLFYHSLYITQFKQNKNLITRYPDLIYEKLPNEYKPDIRPEKVSKSRLYIDSTSASLASKCLCPYGRLYDNPVVSFMYPSEEKAKELGINRRNILDECDEFFKGLYGNNPTAMAEWSNVYKYYKDIEGCNFNESKHHYSYHNDRGTYVPVRDIKGGEPYLDLNTCMHYYGPNGEQTSCFVTFSTGGIHGAEYNQELYHEMNLEIDEINNERLYVQSLYPDPNDLQKAKTVEVNGQLRKWNDFIRTKKKGEISYNYKPLVDKQEVFVKGTGMLHGLNSKFKFTSADKANHEDFESYYPSMLMMMRAFYNEGLGYDRYAEIFENKRRFGNEMKVPGISEEDRNNLNDARNGTKLILNSASGAGDATYDTSIRMNNNIISMRIIGQLFSWRIGQAQSNKGALIVSTNTDGLYSVMEIELNDRILEEEAKTIGVVIEPEPMYLISKDSNSRLEMHDDEHMGIFGASGGTLACRNGPSPAKSLAHPAIIDWSLSEYLKYLVSDENKQSKNLNLYDPMDTDVLLAIFQRASAEFEPVKYLNMFQNMVTARKASNNYPFAIKFNSEDSVTPTLIQDCNRTFVVNQTEENKHLTRNLITATLRKITPATKAKRIKDNIRAQLHDELALYILSTKGITPHNIPSDYEATTQAIRRLPESYFTIIDNRDLSLIPEQEVMSIVQSLNFEYYMQIAISTYEDNWMNKRHKKKVIKPVEPKKPKVKAATKAKVETKANDDLIGKLEGIDYEVIKSSNNSVVLDHILMKNNGDSNG